MCRNKRLACYVFGFYSSFGLLGGVIAMVGRVGGRSPPAASQPAIKGWRTVVNRVFRDTSYSRLSMNASKASSNALLPFSMQHHPATLTRLVLAFITASRVSFTVSMHLPSRSHLFRNSFRAWMASCHWAGVRWNFVFFIGFALLLLPL